MSKSIKERIADLNWNSVQQTLDEQGYAPIPVLLNQDECNEIMNTYEQQALFRSTINMAQYRFGIGEYKYYQAPIPDLLQQLREGFYPELAKTANRWLEQLVKESNYPDDLIIALYWGRVGIIKLRFDMESARLHRGRDIV